MINNATLVARIGKQPDLTYSQSGTPLCKFSLAVARRGKGDEADWLNIVCFGKTAEFVAQYLDKGALVGVEGRIQTRQYEKDGQTLDVRHARQGPEPQRGRKPGGGPGALVTQFAGGAAPGAEGPRRPLRKVVELEDT
jgi:single-stranded DNA-binding protein